jgi:hypothetical protein
MYVYNLQILKEQRQEVKERMHDDFAEQEVKITIHSFNSARQLWNTPPDEIREIVKDKLEILSDDDLPQGHEFEEEENVRLVVDWDNDKVIFNDSVKLRRFQQNQPTAHRRRF